MNDPRTLADLAREAMIAEAEISGHMAKHAHYVRVNTELFAAGEHDLAEFALEGANEALAAAETAARVLTALIEERVALVGQIAGAN